MLHDKQKVICHTLIIVVAFIIVMLGSYYSTSFVSAFSLQPTIHHHNKVFDKKQESDSSSSSDTKGRITQTIMVIATITTTMITIKIITKAQMMT